MRTPLCLQLASTHVSWLTLTECDRNSHAQREAFIIRVDSLRIRDCEYLMPVVFAHQAADSALNRYPLLFEHQVPEPWKASSSKYYC